MEKDVTNNSKSKINLENVNTSQIETFYDSKKLTISDYNITDELSYKKVKTYTEMLDSIDYTEYIDVGTIVEKDFNLLNSNFGNIIISNKNDVIPEENDISFVKKKKKMKKSKKTSSKIDTIQGCNEDNSSEIKFSNETQFSNNIYYQNSQNNIPNPFKYNFYHGMLNPFMMNNFVPILIPYRIDQKIMNNQKKEQSESIIGPLSSDEEFLKACNSSEGNLGIQNLIENSKVTELEIILKLIKTNFDSLYSNTYGNHVVQKFIDTCNSELVSKLKHKIKEKVDIMIYNVNGIHILIKFCYKTNKFNFLKKFIKENFLQCVRNNYSISLMQRILRNNKYPLFKVRINSLFRHLF